MANGFTPDTRILQIGMIMLTVLFYSQLAFSADPQACASRASNGIQPFF